MTLAPALLAAALAFGIHAGIAPGAPPGVEHPGSLGASATSITAEPSTGVPFRPVTIVVRISSGSPLPDGQVTVHDGASTLAEGLPLVRGAASFTTSSLGSGRHDLTATYFSAVSGTAGSVSRPVVAEYGISRAVDAGNVAVTIPRGTLTLTQLPASSAPGRSRSGVVDVMITDTRAGDLGFTVSAAVGPCAGRLRLEAQQVAGNALRARDVRVVERAPDRAFRSPRAVAWYPAGLSTGATHLHGLLTTTGSTAGACLSLGSGATTLTLTAM